MFVIRNVISNLYLDEEGFDWVSLDKAFQFESKEQAERYMVHAGLQHKYIIEEIM